MRLIESHNQEYELGLHSYELGMNHLGDMVNIIFLNPLSLKTLTIHIIWFEKSFFFSTKL